MEALAENNLATKWSLGQKMIGVIVNPKRTFEYLSNNPDWKTPLAMLTVGGAFLAALYAPSVIWSATDSLELNLSERTILLLTISSSLISGIFAFISLLASTLLLHIVCSYLGSTSVTYKETLAVIGYATLPGVIKIFILAVFLVTTESLQAGSGLTGLLAQGDGSYSYKVLKGADLFSIWSLILQTVAISILFKLSWKKSVSVVGLFWIAGLAVKAVLPA